MVKDKINLENIEVVVIDPDRSIRQMIRNILSDAGVKRIEVGATMADLMASLQVGTPDLLIADHNLEGGVFCDFVHRLRHHETTHNPFMPIIATAWNPTHDVIREIIQSGVDHIITKPLSASQLTNRIKVIARARKPFVVTSQYIGPDRRGDERESEIERVRVPNTLHTKAVAGKTPDMDLVQSEIDRCITSINTQKLDRNAQQVAFLVERIVPGLSVGAPDNTTSRSLDRLLYVAEDIARRMVNSPYAHVSELCNTLIGVTRRIIDAGDFPVPKDVELLMPLSRSIQAGFDESSDEAKAFARSISDTVGGK